MKQLKQSEKKQDYSFVSRVLAPGKRINPLIAIFSKTTHSNKA